MFIRALTRLFPGFSIDVTCFLKAIFDFYQQYPLQVDEDGYEDYFRGRGSVKR